MFEFENMTREEIETGKQLSSSVCFDDLYGNSSLRHYFLYRVCGRVVLLDVHADNSDFPRGSGWWRYIELPSDFDFTSYLDKLDVLALEVPNFYGCNWSVFCYSRGVCSASRSSAFSRAISADVAPKLLLDFCS